MTSLRTLLVGAMLIALTTLAACGGGAQASSAAATSSEGGGASSAGEPTDEAAATPTENPSTDGGGGGGDDLQAIADQLKPPNSTQSFNQTAEGIIVTIYTSTDSPDSLKSFYESAIPSAGFKIISTSTDAATSSTALVFAKETSSTFGGAISIAPDPSGGSGTTVSVTVGNSQ